MTIRSIQNLSDLGIRLPSILPRPQVYRRRRCHQASVKREFYSEGLGGSCIDSVFECRQRLVYLAIALSKLRPDISHLLFQVSRVLLIESRVRNINIIHTVDEHLLVHGRELGRFRIKQAQGKDFTASPNSDCASHPFS